MGKLIKLLNKYEVEKKPSRLQRNYYLGKGIMYIDEEGEDVDDYRTDYEIISKEYGFIKWLVDNDKIYREGMKGHGRLISYCLYIKSWEWDKIKEGVLLMLLAIQDSPIEFLCSILK